MNKLFRFCSALLVTITLSQAVNAEEDLPAEGQIAPDFKITRFDGSQFQLSDFRGKKPVYLVFWNTWCTYCMKKIPKLQDAAANLDKQIEIIAVNTSLKDSLEKSLAFQKRYEINYPLAFDYGKTVTDLYGVWGTPTEFIIDVNGIVIHRDGVPEDLRAHLANWSTVVEPSTQLATTENCDKEKQTC